MEKAYKLILKNSYEELDYTTELKEGTTFYHIKIVLETRRKLWKCCISFFKSFDLEKLKDLYLFFIKNTKLHLNQLRKIGYKPQYIDTKVLLSGISKVMIYRLKELKVRT